MNSLGKILPGVQLMILKIITKFLFFLTIVFEKKIQKASPRLSQVQHKICFFSKTVWTLKILRQFFLVSSNFVEIWVKIEEMLQEISNKNARSQKKISKLDFLEFRKI